jgi:hypothetical protein
MNAHVLTFTRVCVCVLLFFPFRRKKVVFPISRGDLIILCCICYLNRDVLLTLARKKKHDHITLIFKTVLFTQTKSQVFGSVNNVKQYSTPSNTVLILCHNNPLTSLTVLFNSNPDVNLSRSKRGRGSVPCKCVLIFFVHHSFKVLLNGIHSIHFN